MSYSIKFKSLKTKVLFWFIGSVSILLFLFSYLFYYFLEESITLRIETNLYQNSIKIYNQLKSNTTSLNMIDTKNYKFAIVKGDKIIYQKAPFNTDIKKYLKDERIFFLNEIDEYEIEAYYILKFHQPYDGAIVIYKNGISNKAEDVEDILLFLNPLLLVLLIFIGNKLIDKILLPIKNITKSAKNITIDNFSHTINLPKSDDEIKELVETFNEMINRLHSQVKMIDRFNSDISHELKTPLTVIQGELELCLKQDCKISYYKNSIKTVLDQTKELENLIEALLILTRYSKQNIQDTFTIVYLDSILLNICEKYEKILSKKNIILEIEKLESISMKANLFLITSAFSNIIDNAIKYTPENKNITISLYRYNSKIYFVVKDQGIGIEDTQIDKLTNRFYRVDKSRNKTIKGFGLGLSIVQNSIELHNGTLNIKSKIDKGTTVTITF